MNSQLMFSKASDEWSTPRALFDRLNAEFGFDLDVAATDANTLCDEYYDMSVDALSRDWRGAFGQPTTCWMNPPYSKCREFIGKAYAESLKGCTVVCLVPARTDTHWWHRFVWDSDRHAPYRGVELRFIKGRLKFGDQKNSAPFPSVVIVFRPIDHATT